MHDDIKALIEAVRQVDGVLSKAGNLPWQVKREANVVDGIKFSGRGSYGDLSAEEKDIVGWMKQAGAAKAAQDADARRRETLAGIAVELNTLRDHISQIAGKAVIAIGEEARRIERDAQP